MVISMCDRLACSYLPSEHSGIPPTPSCCLASYLYPLINLLTSPETSSLTIDSSATPSRLLKLLFAPFHPASSSRVHHTLRRCPLSLLHRNYQTFDAVIKVAATGGGTRLTSKSSRKIHQTSSSSAHTVERQNQNPQSTGTAT
jgi:hypothetical protein